MNPMLQWTQNTGLYDAPLLFTYHQERKKAIHDDTMLITEDLLVLSLSYVSLLCFYAFVYVWFILARPNLRIGEIYVCVCVCLRAHACSRMCSVVSDSLQPHGLYPTRLLCTRGFSRQENWSGLPFPTYWEIF